MDIEKICRCCLALSGPLLTIYDKGPGGSVCLADMLCEVAKLKPRSDDKLPGNVCIACISEINRCYVFKIKCENANSTLRQMLPEALPEPIYAASSKKELCDMGVQTDVKEVQFAHVQTEAPTTPSRNHKVVQTESNIYNKSYTRFASAKTKSSPSARSKENAYKRFLSTSPLPEEEVSTKRFCEDNTARSPLADENESYIVVESVSNDSSNDEDLIIQAVCEEPEEISKLHYYEELGEQEKLKQDHDSTKGSDENEEIYESLYDCYEDKQIQNDQEADDIDVISVTSTKSHQNSTEADEKRNTISLPRCSQRREQYKCAYCIMTFVSLKVLLRHMAKRHNVDGSDVNIESTATFMTTEVMEETNEEAEEDGQMSNSDAIELTMNNVPNPQLCCRERESSRLEVEPLKDKEYKYNCDNCGAGFALRKTLAYHLKHNICSTDNFECTICERNFVSKDNLEAHMETHKMQHSCLECNHICETVDELSEHMIVQHNRNPRNQCHVCKKVFTIKSSLMDHLRIHSGEKPFLCTVCGKRFRQNSNLRQHLMRHTNVKNFKCDLCPNAYVTKSELFSHKRTHTGDHPFKCDICGNCLTSSSSLLKHKRRHTGERPYACELCPMRFATLNVLKNHRRTHTGERPYKCSFCDKSFTQKGDCLLHQRHHEFGDLKCFCGSKFSKTSNLRQHIKNKHPNMTDENRKQLEEMLLSHDNPNSETIEFNIDLQEGDNGEQEEGTSYLTIQT